MSSLPPWGAFLDGTDKDNEKRCKVCGEVFKNSVYREKLNKVIGICIPCRDRFIGEA